MSEYIEVTAKVFHITDTQPQPGKIWTYLVINAEGRSHSASRYTINEWLGLPWDFGQPLYFTGNPIFKIPETMNPTKPQP